MHHPSQQADTLRLHPCLAAPVLPAACSLAHCCLQSRSQAVIAFSLSRFGRAPKHLPFDTTRVGFAVSSLPAAVAYLILPCPFEIQEALSILLDLVTLATWLLFRGCNVLECLKLNCPSLTSFDATFCTQLDSLTLSRALTGAPRLTALVLSVCMGLDPVIPATMCSIARLSLLDLSYTGIEVTNVQVLHALDCSCFASLVPCLDLSALDMQRLWSHCMCRPAWYVHQLLQKWSDCRIVAHVSRTLSDRVKFDSRLYTAAPMNMHKNSHITLLSCHTMDTMLMQRIQTATRCM